MKSKKLLVKKILFIVLSSIPFFSKCEFEDVDFVENNNIEQPFASEIRDVDFTDSEYIADYSDLDESLLSADMEKALCATEFIPVLTPCDIIDLIVNVLFSDPYNVDALFILSKNLYLRTNRILKRDLHTLPSFLIFHNNEYEYCKEFRFVPFYNQTLQQYFYGNCPFIKSYIAIDDADIIDEIAKLNSLVEKNIPDFIALFKNAKLEDRRAGFMFQWLKNWNKTTLEARIPLLYQERNFNFTEEEIVAIKQSDFFSASNDNKVEETAIMKHVIADLLGIGDLRLRLSHLFINLPCQQWRLGLELNVPTAFAFKKGLIGGDFSHDTQRPFFNLLNFVNMITSNNPTDKECAVEIGRELLLQAADRLAAVILQTNLGNDKHIGLGLFVEPEIVLSDLLRINALATATYVFPQRATRYFLRSKNPSCFNRQKYLDDLATCGDEGCGSSTCNTQALENDVLFLQDQIINTFFPDAFNTIVSPGFMLQAVIAPTITVNDWQGTAGLDFWYVQQEQLEPKGMTKACYQFCKGITPAAFQAKVFVRLLRTIPYCNFDFGVSFNADCTFASRNIGQDFTAAIGFEFNF